MSEFERPDRMRREPTVEDVRQLMGASTPHFALQIRNRIRTLIAGCPPTTLRASRASARSRGSTRSRSAPSAAARSRSTSTGLPSYRGPE